jgi:hypothetical protein
MQFSATLNKQNFLKHAYGLLRRFNAWFMEMLGNGRGYATARGKIDGLGKRAVTSRKSDAKNYYLLRKFPRLCIVRNTAAQHPTETG